MAIVAQAEREAISMRTKEALAVARSRGMRLGNPNGAAALRRADKSGFAAPGSHCAERPIATRETSRRSSPTSARVAR